MRHPSIRVPVSFSVSLSFVGSFESLRFVVTARLLPPGARAVLLVCHAVRVCTTNTRWKSSLDR